MGNEIGVSAVMNFVINSRAESVAIGVGKGPRRIFIIIYEYSYYNFIRSKIIVFVFILV